MSVKRNKFLTSKEVYNDRLKICKSCEYYFKPTGTCKRCGCFMRIKAKIAPVSCPVNKWQMSGAEPVAKELDQDLVQEVLDVYPFIKDRRAATHKIKEQAIEVYNVIHGTGYDKNTNCGSCVFAVWKGLSEIYEKYKND
tara:strand:+ start:15199 stop:15615 length:417 start_codon:yes stop_codon:yes gene_type:complete